MRRLFATLFFADNIYSLPWRADQIPRRYSRRKPGEKKNCFNYSPIRDQPNSDAACVALFTPSFNFHQVTAQIRQATWPAKLMTESFMADHVVTKRGAHYKHGKSIKTRKHDLDRVLEHGQIPPNALNHKICDFNCSDTSPERLLKQMEILLDQTRYKFAHRLFCQGDLVIQFARRYSVRRYEMAGEVEVPPRVPKLVWKCSCIPPTPGLPWQEMESEEQFNNYLQAVAEAQTVVRKEYEDGVRTLNEYSPANNVDFLLEAAEIVRKIDMVEFIPENLQENTLQRPNALLNMTSREYCQQDDTHSTRPSTERSPDTHHGVFLDSSSVLTSPYASEGSSEASQDRDAPRKKGKLEVLSADPWPDDDSLSVFDWGTDADVGNW